jgi:hypothetical protein
VDAEGLVDFREHQLGGSECYPELVTELRGLGHDLRGVDWVRGTRLGAKVRECGQGRDPARGRFGLGGSELLGRGVKELAEARERVSGHGTPHLSEGQLAENAVIPSTQA